MRVGHSVSPFESSVMVLSLPFRRLLLLALIAGSIASLAFTLLQQWLLVPAILRAEALEAGRQATPDHEAVRMLSTAVFNWLAALGYGSLLLVAMILRRHDGWLLGLGWGAAGWAAFALAPALGLPPQLPGGAEAALALRQLWWIHTVAATAAGLSLLIFGLSKVWKVIGALLLVVPHLAATPGPGWHTLPQAAFIFAIGALAVTCVFWLTLGTACGALLARQPAR